MDTKISASDSLITHNMHLALEAAPAMDRGEKELFLGTPTSKTTIATWVDSPWLLVAKRSPPNNDIVAFAGTDRSRFTDQVQTL